MMTKQTIKRTEAAFPGTPVDEIWLASVLTAAHLVIPTFDNDNDIAAQHAVQAPRSRRK